MVYLDDILIFLKNKEEHVAHVKKVLERLRRFGLFAKPLKCDFMTNQVDFLGFIIDADGVLIKQSRVTAILEWPIPTLI